MARFVRDDPLECRADRRGLLQRRAVRAGEQGGQRLANAALAHRLGGERFEIGQLCSAPSMGSGPGPTEFFA